MKKLLFHISAYDKLAQKVLQSGQFDEGVVTVRSFDDGERYQRIDTDVHQRDVVIIGGTVRDSATLELYDLASSVVSYGAKSLHLVIPYFGYSTMERAVLKREVVTAKTRARLLSSIPKSFRGNSIYLFDLHSEGIPHYFEHDLHPVHIYCKNIIMQAAREYGGEDFVLASTDAGRAKWVESLANDLNVNAAFLLKRRIQNNTTEVTAINADVDGKTVIIYDDMIRSGGSIINAAEVYKKGGATKIYVITTHGLFINDGLNKIKKSGLVEKVISTDTYPGLEDYHDDFLEVRTVADLIIKNLK